MKNKGITLVALVITIIILLILAGVSISLVFIKQEGVLDKASLAVDSQNKGTEREALELVYNELFLVNITGENNVDLSNTIMEKLNQKGLAAIATSTDTDTYNVIFENTKNTWEFNPKTRELNYVGKYDGIYCAHSWTFVENISPATCTEDGMAKYKCELCDTEKEVKIPKLGHDESSEWQYTSQGHYHSCIRCGIKCTEIENHTSPLPCSICGYTGTFTVTNSFYKLTGSNTQTNVSEGGSYSTTITPENPLSYKIPDDITITMGGVQVEKSGYNYNNYNGSLTIYNIRGNIVINASAVNYNENISFTNAKEFTTSTDTTEAITQAYQIRTLKFTPTEDGIYRFWSNDPDATAYSVDPYAYLYDPVQKPFTIEELDGYALNYALNHNTSDLSNKSVAYNDDAGEGYNFSITHSCTAGVTYYLAIRTFNTSLMETYDNIRIDKN